MEARLSQPPGSWRDRIVVWLRGDYNSVRHRFLTLPKAWTKYLLGYSLRGRSWIDFYSNRLDGSARRADVASVAPHYMKAGRDHVEYLKAHGLRPEHMVLDYGCGILRAGIPLIKYLGPARYVGVEISKERLALGRELAAREGIREEDYRVFTVQDCSLREIRDFRFDYVWAKSVFTHMPAQDIREMLRSLKPLLKENGVFLFTFAVADRERRRNIKDFYYPIPVMRAMCEGAGYRFEVLADWDPVEQGDTMGRLRLAAD